MDRVSSPIADKVAAQEAATEEPPPTMTQTSVDLDTTAQEADDKSWPKQRRKRTSAEDQTILESAYQRDPKPDKVARQTIVDQVALTEKEVQVMSHRRISHEDNGEANAKQIWFQNRRQSSRRKSRPLLPHEIIQYQLHRSEHAVAHDAQNSSFSFPSMSQERPEEEEPVNGEEESSSIDVGSHQAQPTTSHTLSRETLAVVGSEHSGLVASIGGATDAENKPALVSEKSGMGYLANRRSAQSLSQAQAPSRSNNLPKDADTPARRLRKSSSHVRLSTSFEGNATVVSYSSPSPPRAPPINLSSSQGSGSGLTNLSSSQKSLQRSSSGRSRDSRAWEFWCDRDARNELSEKVSRIANGSAADAIGLLRSTSGRSILGPSSLKRNSLLTRQPADVKRVKATPELRMFRRSSTFSGRPSDATAKTRPKLKHSESTLSARIPGNESDKENWVPGSGHVATNGDDIDKQRPRKSTGDDEQPVEHQLPSLRNTASGKGKHDDPENDPEISAFMRGGRKSSSISSEDDLDCIQGLLSLSQGNWR